MIEKNTISQLRHLLDTKELSALELTEHYLERIEQHHQDLNCYITLTPQLAREQAKEADKKISQGLSLPLTGIPYAQKDIFCTQGVRTTCGSKMLENFVSPYNATVTQRFCDQNAVMLGKANMDEFAMGSSNEHSYFGSCPNPHDLNKVPGGSSGGSACAVASDLAVFATGSDTGGSIRQPAAFCHLVGLKPTYGRISRFGMIAFASSFDQAGPLTRSVEDAALVLDAMTGSCPNDSTCADLLPTQAFKNLEKAPKDFKVGCVRQFFERLSPSMQKSFESIFSHIKEIGGQVEMIDLPMIDEMIPTYYIIAPAEASSNLARYDGVRYGHRSSQAQTLEDLYVNSRSEGFGAEVKRRILTGTYVLTSGYYDAYYGKAQKIRTLITEKFAELFQTYQFILTPTTLESAFSLHAHDNDPTAMYYSDLCTVSANLAGLPAISLPALKEGNMPFGVQFIAPHFEEEKLLSMSYALEKLYKFELENKFTQKEAAL